MADENKQKEPSLVAKVFARCKNDKGFAATLKRADNPDTAYQAWEILATYGVPLDKDFKRLPYALVLAAVARSSNDQDGKLGLGAALANAYQDDGGRDVGISFERLLKDLVFFNSEKTLASWAQDFFGSKSKENEEM